MSLTSAMNSAISGLAVNSRLADLASTNIANAATPGQARDRALGWLRARGITPEPVHPEPATDDNIHPIHKQVVGKRMATIAGSLTYRDSGLSAPAPAFGPSGPLTATAFGTPEGGRSPSLDTKRISPTPGAGLGEG